MRKKPTQLCKADKEHSLWKFNRKLETYLVTCKDFHYCLTKLQATYGKRKYRESIQFWSPCRIIWNIVTKTVYKVLTLNLKCPQIASNKITLISTVAAPEIIEIKVVSNNSFWQSANRHKYSPIYLVYYQFSFILPVN